MNEEVQQVDEIFGEDQDIKDLDKMGELGNMVSIDLPRYLKNIGQPAKITVSTQSAISWKDESGRIIKVETILKGDEAGRDVTFGLGLNEGNKCWIYYINGRQQKFVVFPIDKTFSTFDYPHILEFPIGYNKMSERQYTLLCGQLVRVDNSAHADVILNNFAYVIETDEGGKPLSKDNKYLKDLHSKPVKASDTKSVDYKSLDTVDISVATKNNQKPVQLEESNDRE